MGSLIRTGASQPELEVLDFHVLVSKSFNKSGLFGAKLEFYFPPTCQPLDKGTAYSGNETVALIDEAELSFSQEKVL